jgi:hypothetical protein
MIVVMGKRWGGTGRVGSRRIDDPGDFVRLEVASGLKRPELKMIPALISGAKMLGPSALPDDLKDLSRRNAIELSDTRWREDVERLIASLELDMAAAAPRHAAAADLVRKAREITHAPALSSGSAMRWGLIGAAVLVVALGARALFGHGSAAAKNPPAATISVKSAGMISGIPTDDPHAMPSHLAAAARSAIASGKQWRSDAVLTQIVAAPDSTGDAAAFRVQYGFRSPTDGAGLALTEGASGQPVSERLAAIPMSTIRALPDSFLDLPAAVDSARHSGMFGALREGRLASITSRGAQRIAWRLKSASADSRLYYIDATTGALITSPPPAPSTAPQSKLVNKVKKLFH